MSAEPTIKVIGRHIDLPISLFLACRYLLKKLLRSIAGKRTFFSVDRAMDLSTDWMNRSVFDGLGSMDIDGGTGLLMVPDVVMIGLCCIVGELVIVDSKRRGMAMVRRLVSGTVVDIHLLL